MNRINEGVISVIIPVYNVENFLKKCVKSVTMQTYQNLQIILIDDASTDSSGTLCDKLAQSDSRILVIHRGENQGLGSARNLGMSRATGEFLTFVDSDDYLELDACEKLMIYTKKDWADAYFFGFYNVSGSKKMKPCFLAPAKSLYGKDECFELLLDAIGEGGNGFVKQAVWAVLYRNEFLCKHAISFTIKRGGEDLPFSLAVVLSLDEASIVPEYFYNHVFNPASISNAYSPDLFDAALLSYTAVQSTLQEYGIELKHNQRIDYRFLINTLSCIKRELFFKKTNGTKLANANIRNICNNEVLRDILDSYPLSSLPFKKRVFFKALKNKRYGLLHILTRLKLIIK
jgi:glycosyltransferase involved in cell wall biosynthesis